MNITHRKVTARRILYGKAMKYDGFALSRINAAVANMETEFNCYYGKDYTYVYGSGNIVFQYKNDARRYWVTMNNYSGYRELFQYIRELFIKHKGDIKND